MKWYEVTVETASESVEAVANILMESGASGVAIEDALDAQNWQSDAYGELADISALTDLTEGAKVTAYFPETIFLPEILPFIKETLSHLPEYGLALGKNQVSLKEVDDGNWGSAWKKYYHPVRVTRFLTIVPSWEDYQSSDSQEKIIRLDPGMAFGTGTHPTTALTLQALEMVLRGEETILDVGTGSGVLSIASKHLGAKAVHAYDLDEVAVRSAKENMDLNPIAKDVVVSANNLLTGIDIKADVIVANILADIIILMIEDAKKLLTEEGHLIVSGIIAAKKDLVVTEMKKAGFEVAVTLNQKDWYALILKKAQDNSDTINPTAG